MARETPTEIISHMTYGAIKLLSEDELQGVIKECAMMNKTNCSWVAYALRVGLVVLVKKRLEYLGWVPGTRGEEKCSTS